MESSEKQKAVRQVKDWIRQNRAELRTAGVHTIVAFYSGEGDEGCLDSYLEVVNSEGKAVNTKIVDGLYPLLETLHDEIAPEGYENNEGGGGEFRLNVEAATITHESYYLTVERSYSALEEY